MARSSAVFLAMACCLLFKSASHAQTTLDVSKITCEQFLSYKITSPNNIAVWVSGYYNGQQGNTLLDIQALQEHIETVKSYCVKRLNMTVMQAVENVLVAKK